MQDPSGGFIQQQFPEQEQLRCPRCDSNNTKFCYYNNYNLSQPRHFCKNCKRYWTKGGTLRNIPIGGGSRKNTKRSSNSSKRSSSSNPIIPSIPSSSSSSSSTTQLGQNPAREPEPEPEPKLNLDIPVSFTSLLASSNGQFGNLLECLGPNGPSPKTAHLVGTQSLNSGSGYGSVRNPGSELQNGGDSSCWDSGNGWPDLSSYTPGSRFL